MTFRLASDLCALFSLPNNQSKFLYAAKLQWPIQMQCKRPVTSYHRYLGQQRRRWGPAVLQLLNRVRSRYCIWKLNFLFSQQFDEIEFLAGTKQAASVMMSAVRRSDWNQISNFSTPESSCDVYVVARDWRKNLYADLVRFEPEHFRTVMPVSVKTRYHEGHWYVCVDMAFVGLRNIQDFESQAEQCEMQQLMQRVLEESNLPCSQQATGPQRVMLCEMLLSFRRELVIDPEMSDSDRGWLIDFYKMYKFKLVNYSPFTLKYRVIEFIN